MKITFGESYEVQSTLNWYGTVDFTAPKAGYSNNGLRFFSRDSHDLKVAKILETKFSELFTDFQFYKEEGVEKVLFSTTNKARLTLS